ncbi:MAG TPA: hypothetical protein VFB45_02570 [Pseudolabrys sp.]|nr:hypothetical protein [Pseudolabrys sp.]
MDALETIFNNAEATRVFLILSMVYALLYAAFVLIRPSFARDAQPRPGATSLGTGTPRHRS